MIVKLHFFLLRTLLVALACLCLRAETAGQPLPDQPDTSLVEPTVQWKPLLWQTFFFTSVENGFRLGTQDFTRHSLRGKFFNDWGESIGNLHSWGDGDPFLTNYIGHPMQGAVSAYIFVHNDPRYKRTEFGRNREYWKSRLRATLFSFAASEQFELGPFSEANLGNTQAYHPQQGFVDHVVTPTLGLAWMVGEDALDKYVVERMEARTDNSWIKLFLRGGLNPSRSMANAIRLKVPWYRDTRGGVFAQPTAAAVRQRRNRSSFAFAEDLSPVRPILRRKSRSEPALNEVSAALVPTFELTSTYSFYQLAIGKQGSLACHGGGAVATYNVNGWLGITADVGAAK